MGRNFTIFGFLNWHRCHKCDPKAIETYARSLLHNGESSVDVMADFIKVEQNVCQYLEDKIAGESPEETCLFESEELAQFVPLWLPKPGI